MYSCDSSGDVEYQLKGVAACTRSWFQGFQDDVPPARQALRQLEEPLANPTIQAILQGCFCGTLGALHTAVTSTTEVQPCTLVSGLSFSIWIPSHSLRDDVQRTPRNAYHESSHRADSPRHLKCSDDAVSDERRAGSRTRTLNPSTLGSSLSGAFWQ